MIFRFLPWKPPCETAKLQHGGYLAADGFFNGRRRTQFIRKESK
nr:MAG TPA: hypothetical protein [Caudoviricetes sp.]